MSLYHKDKSTEIHNGDCLQVLRTLPDSSVDSCVTDPPYGLAFMGKKWDYDVPSSEVWQEVLRVLKPGGHLLAFAGTRTQHRMAVRIEDAGFEIRDLLAWVYGSGFPKSLDVSKAIDKAAGAEREVLGENPNHRAVSGVAYSGCYSGKNTGSKSITAPATEAAKQWQGWGTALKPALEPITMARAPLSGTVAANVLEHGTGAVNVDGCRIEGEYWGESGQQSGGKSKSCYGDGLQKSGRSGSHSAGRFPANLIHDGSDEVVGLFPETVSGNPMERMHTDPGRNVASGASKGGEYFHTGFGDSGSAARFFYCAKADASERRSSKHPTVKPVALMRHLVRLVCPAGGVVLDPFAGSGTTIEAARLEHCRAIGIEREAEYCADILERLRQGVLF